MTDKLNYISDEELEQLIYQVEQDELVTAPPDLAKSIVAAACKKEFYAYCFRVVTSVAAAVALVFLLPEMTDWMGRQGSGTQIRYDKQTVVGTIPSQKDVVKQVPEKKVVVADKVTPTKEEVLDDTGVVERIIRNLLN